MDRKKTIIGIICSLISCPIYGLSFLFTKNATDSVSPFTLLSWRFLFAFIFLSICAATHLIRINLKGKSLKPLVLLAIFHPVLYFLCETFGIKMTTASESGTIISVIPIVTVLCTAIILKQKPSKWQVIGISTTTIGVFIIIFARGLQFTFDALGYFLLLGAVFSYGLFSTYAKKADAFSAIERTYVMVSFGAFIFTMLAVIENSTKGELSEFAILPFANTDFLIAVLYLGLGSCVLAFFLSNISISYIGTNRTASFVGITTVISIISGVIVLKENFSIIQIIGTVFVIGGVYIANAQIANTVTLKSIK